jgi:DNA (cytosine-5)-methyltransferase 1
MTDIKKIGYIDKDREQCRVHSIDGIMPTITANNAGGRRPGGLIIEFENDKLVKGSDKLTNINEVKEVTSEGKPFNYVSLFSGIGGFEQALNKLGGTCVMASEIDKYANQAYEILYGHPTVGDVTKVAAEDVPDHDLLVGGFPCQAFSVAGKRLGFEEARGTLFFEIARIAKVKQPKAMLLENVKGLVSHDKGKTLDTIIHTLAEIGYTVDFEVLNSKYFGVPQNRERIFIVAVRDDLVAPQAWDVGKRSGVVAKGKRRIKELGVKTFNFDWPAQEEVTVRLRDILENGVDERFYLSEEKTAKLVAQLEEKDKVVGSVGHHPFSKKFEFSGYNSDISPTLLATDYKAPKTLLEVAGLPIREATKQGYAVAEEGDAVNFQFPDSNTHRGRVGKQIANTLEASGINQGVVDKGDSIGEEKERNTAEVLRSLRKGVGEEAVAEWRLRILASFQPSEVLRQGVYGKGFYGKGNNGRSELVHGTQTGESDKEGEDLRKMQCDKERRYTPQGRELEEQFAREFTSLMSELSRKGTPAEKEMQDLWESTQGSRLLREALYKIQEVWRSSLPKTRYRIRKLTPKETFRLQGFPDAEFDKLTANGISNSQLYKMAGNAVTVNVISAIGKRLLPYLNGVK